MRHLVVRRMLALGVALGPWLAHGQARADPTIAGVDYNAPDPNRNALNVARGVGNLLFNNFVITQIDRFRGKDWAYSTHESIGRSLTSGFEFDYDPLHENLVGHPLHGALYFNSARAAGLSFWESSLFPILGSLVWDFVGERQVIYPGGWHSKPSVNDFVSTSTSGPFLGEALYRLSSELLDESATGVNRVLREVAASAVNPMRGFNRLYTGEMWQRGAPPEHLQPLNVAVDVGASRLTLLSRSKGYDPAAVLAIEIEYGDLLPSRKHRTLEPFEFFEGYLAANLFNSQVGGTQVYGNGLLFGWSTPISDDEGELRDNNVLGFVTNFDYQGTTNTRFGSMSAGVGDFVEWRFGKRRRVRLGTDIGWNYLLGTNSPFAIPEKGYDYGMGPALGLNLRVELGRYGQLVARSRHYIAAVLDGQGHQEAISYARLAYDVDVVPHVGVGVAPMFLSRRSSSGALTVTETSLETQLYLRVHN